MRHDPASGAVVIMLRSLKMHGMAQAVTDLIEQGAPAFESAVDLPGFCGERLAHFPGLSLEGDGALEAER